MLSSRSLFTDEQVKDIESAIKAAEKMTSGEIRVFIENDLPKGVSVLDRSVVKFNDLKLNETKLRNGVLFYIAVNARQFAILGDKGINEKVADDFWDKIKDEMQLSFRDSRFSDGLIKGIGMAAEALISIFPYSRDDVNELPDEVVFG